MDSIVSLTTLLFPDFEENPEKEDVKSPRYGIFPFMKELNDHFGVDTPGTPTLHSASAMTNDSIHKPI